MKQNPLVKTSLVKTSLIIKIQFNKNLELGDYSRIASTLLNLLPYNPEVYPRDYSDNQGYIYIFENAEDKSIIYRMLNALVGITSFEYETIL